MTPRKSLQILFRFCAALGFLLVFVSFTPVITWWAKAYAGPIQQPKGDVLILLSAASDDEYGGISYSSYWRARQALFAWQTGGFKKIVICGNGDPGIFDFLIVQGIPRDAFVVERRSTTHEKTLLKRRACFKACWARRSCSPAISICCAHMPSSAG